ncbi:MAG: signal peptidase I [Armatimonadetes bacterium]|nr:signal peptidase I [Armatimonadota bacterium]
MGITERLANLNTVTVIITVVVLLIIRFVLLRLDRPMAKSIAEIAESLAVAMALVFLLIRPFFVQAFFIPSESMLPGLRIDDHILVNKLIYRLREPKLGDVVVFKAPPEATPDVVRQVEMEADERGLTGSERKDFIAREEKAREKDFIKRVIGVPGDIVRITPGYVLINGVQYSHEELGSQLSSFSEASDNHSVKLLKDKMLVNGQIVTKAEVASAVGQPNGKVKIVPGIVYLNGRALKESYTAEDPDKPYPTDDTPANWIVTKKEGGREVRYVKIPKGKLLVMGDNRNESFDARFWGLLDRERVLGKAMFIFWPVTRVRLVH